MPAIADADRHPGARPARPGVPRARLGRPCPTSSPRTWPPATPPAPPSCPTGSRRCCTSPTAAACTPAGTPAPATGWCSRRPARTPGWTPTGPTRSTRLRAGARHAAPAGRRAAGGPGCTTSSRSASTDFLVLELVEGSPLNQLLVAALPADRRRTPTAADSPTTPTGRWTSTGRSSEAVDADPRARHRLRRPAPVQHHGRPTTSAVTLLDFEVAAPVEPTPGRPALAQPGVRRARATAPASTSTATPWPACGWPCSCR